jgi:hypothetical protein
MEARVNARQKRAQITHSEQEMKQIRAKGLGVGAYMREQNLRSFVLK